MDLIFLGVFILTQVGDFATTVTAIKRGGTEMNPLIKATMDNLGYFGLALWKFWASGVMIWLYFQNSPYFVFVCGGLILFFAVVLSNNLRAIRELKK